MLLTFFHQGAHYINYTVEDAQQANIPDAVINQAQQEAMYDSLVAERRQAYALESDPIYSEWQYDKTAEKEQQWRDKVAEIKARYPLPPKA